MVLKRTARSAIGCLLVLALASCGAHGGGAEPSLPAVTLAPLSLDFPEGGARPVEEIVKAAPLTVFVFFATACPVQKAHDARLLAMARELSPRGVQFVAVASEVDATRDEVVREAKSRSYPFPIVLDPHAAVARAFGVENATMTVVLDTSGKMRYRGSIDSDRTHLRDEATPFLRDALASLLAGEEPKTRETKPLGCMLRTS